MKVLYLFSGRREGSVKEVIDGKRPDDSFFGMLRLQKIGVDADYAELEKVYPKWLSEFIRKYLSINLIHVPIFGCIFKSDVIFASTSFGAELIHAILHIRKPKWVIYDFSLTGLIGDGKTIKQKVFKWMVGRAGGIITLSKKETQELKKLFPNLQDRIEFVPFGADLEFFRPRYDVPAENKIISVGLDPNRDYVALMEATKGLGVKVSISKSRNMESIEHTLPPHVETVFWSWDELIDVYHKAKIVVIPLDIRNKINDASGTTSVAQAMAMGKAIIATRTPTMESYITHNENGILVEPGNVSELRKAIEDLLSDEVKRERLGRNARIFAEQNCDADKSAKKMSDFFSRICNN